MLIVIIIIACLILICLVAFWKLKDHPQYITGFIKENPNRSSNTALAVFFNDLKDWEKIIIDWNLSRFELKVLLDEKFKNAVKEKL